MNTEQLSLIVGEVGLGVTVILGIIGIVFCWIMSRKQTKMINQQTAILDQQENREKDEKNFDFWFAMNEFYQLSNFRGYIDENGNLKEIYLHDLGSACAKACNFYAKHRLILTDSSQEEMAKTAMVLHFEITGGREYFQKPLLEGWSKCSVYQLLGGECDFFIKMLNCSEESKAMVEKTIAENPYNLDKVLEGEHRTYNNLKLLIQAAKHSVGEYEQVFLIDGKPQFDEDFKDAMKDMSQRFRNFVKNYKTQRETLHSLLYPMLVLK